MGGEKKINKRWRDYEKKRRRDDWKQRRRETEKTRRSTQGDRGMGRKMKSGERDAGKMRDNEHKI